MEAESREQRTECKKYIITVREVVQSHPYPNDTTLLMQLLAGEMDYLQKKMDYFQKIFIQAFSSPSWSIPYK
jgi:hypothetical protein